MRRWSSRIMASRIVSELNYAEKNRRYEQQTAWSAELRQFIYKQLPQGKLKILEVGCGTGAVLRCVEREIPDRVRLLCGVDIDPEALRFASENGCGNLSAAFGEALPFPENSFDLVLCHYLLLWVKDPVDVLKEMRRVTRTGGITAALAEPCYAEMTAAPAELGELAKKQREALICQGIDPEAGRKLAAEFQAAGFPNAVQNRYREKELSTAEIKREIDRMLADSLTDFFPFHENLRYDYSVPTYFTIVRK